MEETGLWARVQNDIYSKARGWWRRPWSKRGVTLFLAFLAIFIAIRLYVGLTPVPVIGFAPRTPPKNKAALVVFIHGVMGDASETWRYEGLPSWPDLARGDAETFGCADVVTYQYFTPFLGEGLRIDEIAEHLLFSINQRETERKQPYESIVLIGHSMGGLIARSLIHNDTTDLRTRTKAVFLLASPAGGSRWAAWADWLSYPLSVLAIPDLGDVRNPQFDEMAPASDWRRGEDEWFVRQPWVPVHCAYEKLSERIWGIASGLIVESENSQCGSKHWVPLTVTHTGMAKPLDRHSDNYQFVAGEVRICEPGASRAPVPEPSPTPTPTSTRLQFAMKKTRLAYFLGTTVMVPDSGRNVSTRKKFQDVPVTTQLPADALAGDLIVATGGTVECSGKVRRNVPLAVELVIASTKFSIGFFRGTKLLNLREFASAHTGQLVSARLRFILLKGDDCTLHGDSYLRIGAEP